jgi:hypothetical protein
MGGIKMVMMGYLVTMETRDHQEYRKKRMLDGKICGVVRA